MVTEVGREPRVVYGVMPTDAAVTGAHGIPVGDATLASAYLVVGGGLAWGSGGSLARRSISHPMSDRHWRRRRPTLLKALPHTFVLAGLALYTALAGADFGAGFWQLLRDAGSARGGSARTPTSMGPVWEANHVWLIFVLTVFWTSYPRAFGSIASTLAVPLFIAALGIIHRGAAYALRAGASGAAESEVIDTIFSVSSALTPFGSARPSGRSPPAESPPATPAGTCCRAV